MNKILSILTLASAFLFLSNAQASQRQDAQNIFECSVFGNFRSSETNSIYVFSGEKKLFIDLVLNEEPIEIGKNGSFGGEKLKLNIVENSPAHLKLSLYDGDTIYSKEVSNQTRLIAIRLAPPTYPASNFEIECVNPASASEHIVEL